MIQTSGLTRRYATCMAVDRLELSIAQGEVFGLLGPNGAGKTTTVRMLTTLLHPSEGKAEVAGFDVVKYPLDVRRRIGYSPQEINLDRDLSGYQNLFLHGLFHAMRYPEARCKELLKWAGMEKYANNIIRTYSGGMQRRLQIARAVMHHPTILFLDEPTVGLDPQIRRTIWELIRTLNNQHIGVLLTTHYIEEAEILCSRIGIMNKGTLIACDTPHNLKRAVGTWVVEVDNNGSTHYHHFHDHDLAHTFAKKQERQTLKIRTTTLEDVFIHFTGESLPL